MTSIEIMSPMLGDAFVDVSRRQAVGFNAVTLRNLRIEGSTISFDLHGVPELRTVLVKFAGIDPRGRYQLVSNGSEPIAIKGEDLSRDGYRFAMRDPSKPR